MPFLTMTMGRTYLPLHGPTLPLSPAERKTAHGPPLLFSPGLPALRTATFLSPPVTTSHPGSLARTSTAGSFRPGQLSALFFSRTCLTFPERYRFPPEETLEDPALDPGICDRVPAPALMTGKFLRCSVFSDWNGKKGTTEFPRPYKEP